MLFELVKDYSKLEPVKFGTIGQIAVKEKNLKEKDLEDLLAKHLLEVLFQGTPLLPFHQEKQGQAVADIYALNQNGDVVIFELKREQAYPGALDQLLRYAGVAGLWSYFEIEQRYREYPGTDPNLSLKQTHALAFNLERDHELHEDQFNRQQHLWVVGSAAADPLIRSVDYWKSKGLSIDFFPYRVYQLGGKAYLEFFAKPYDQHLNPADRKGVLFDTNSTYDYEGRYGHGCLREMLEKRRVAAYGTSGYAVLCFQKNDYVFYSHVGTGIVGAATVIGHSVKKIKNPRTVDEWFLDVELLTPIPTDFTTIPAMSFGEVKSLLGKEFYWPRIDKRPYLSIDESQRLLDELTKILATRTDWPEAVLTQQTSASGGA